MNQLTAIGLSLQDLAKSLPKIIKSKIGIVAQESIKILKAEWPVDTGYSSSSWVALEFGHTWVLMCQAEYSSHIFQPHESGRAPIYLARVPDAVARAISSVDLELQLTDLTREYIGKGAKFSPTNLLWMEVVGRVAPNTAGNAPMFPTVDVAGRQGGIHHIQGRRSANASHKLGA